MSRECRVSLITFDAGFDCHVLCAERMPWLQLHHVFALGVWEGRVYWSDWETRAIESCRRRPDMHFKVIIEYFLHYCISAVRLQLHTHRYYHDSSVLLRRNNIPEKDSCSRKRHVNDSYYYFDLFCGFKTVYKTSVLSVWRLIFKIRQTLIRNSTMMPTQSGRNQ